MFKREARLLTKLHYDGLPKVTDFFTETDASGKTANYIVMTFIEGMDLETFLEKVQKPPIPLDDALLLFRRILAILKYLHSQNPPVIYRDLKPSNVILNDDKLFLVDFGIAKFLEGSKPGTMMGTAGYASPDQCRGNDNLSNDIYSLGVLMHYLLTGMNPLDPSRPMFVFEPIRKLNPAVPEYIDKLVSSMVEIVAANRVPSVEKVIESLDRGEKKPASFPPPVIASAIPSISGIPGFVAGVKLEPDSLRGKQPVSSLITREAFFEAAKTGDIKTAKIGLHQGMDVNGKDEFNWTALHLAAQEGQEQVCELLINYGADLRAATNKGWTPLHVAAFYGQTWTAELLIKKGASVGFTDNNGWIALHMAARKGHAGTLELLLNRGSEINKRENNGWTPLHLAAYNGQTYVAGMLIKNGADLGARDNDGWTPLYFSVQEGKADTTELLIRYGAELNTSDNDGWSPLHIAAWKGQAHIAELLVARGSDINARHTINFGKTPLRLAFEHGRTEIVKFLRKCGARE
jgi:ankyrin repeat protein